jgi:hypothetical protein
MPPTFTTLRARLSSFSMHDSTASCHDALNSDLYGIYLASYRAYIASDMQGTPDALHITRGRQHLQINVRADSLDEECCFIWPWRQSNF